MSDQAITAIAELQRRMATLVRVGVVEQLNAPAAVVRVRVGDNLTDWSPWLTQRAGADRSWWAPEPGEQVLVFAVGANGSQVVVLPALYSADHSAPAGAPTVHRHVYADGASISYDRAAHQWLADVGGASITLDRSQVLLSVGGSTLRLHAGGVDISGALNVGGATNLAASLAVAGNASVAGNVSNAGTNIGATHTHGNVEAGDKHTGTPS